jgi:hypothetical protein
MYNGLGGDPVNMRDPTGTADEPVRCYGSRVPTCSGAEVRDAAFGQAGPIGLGGLGGGGGRRIAGPCQGNEKVCVRGCNPNPNRSTGSDLEVIVYGPPLYRYTSLGPGFSAPTYDRNHPRFHEFGFENYVCFRFEFGCTAGNVWAWLLYNAAPGQTGPATGGGTQIVRSTSLCQDQCLLLWTLT